MRVVCVTRWLTMKTGIGVGSVRATLAYVRGRAHTQVRWWWGRPSVLFGPPRRQHYVSLADEPRAPASHQRRHPSLTSGYQRSLL